MSAAHAAGRRLSPAAEWLLDNHALIEEQIQLARKHFPRGYSRHLPRLAGGNPAGLPRIYDLVVELITHVDGRVDDEALDRYIAAYQSVSPLSLGELWSVAIMLRLALVENLRRVSLRIAGKREDRDRAFDWARRINDPGDRPDNALLVLADMVRGNLPLTTAFVAQFTQALQGRGAATTYVLAWLEQRLAEEGQSIEDVVRAESRSQAADQASMANTIASLRFVNAAEWHTFVESHSATERILRAEPAGVYARMDFATRDLYRHAVEAAARRLRLSEEEVARAAVALAAEARDDVAGHVGYVLVDDGRPHLERALRGRRAAGLLPRPLLRGLQLLSYLGAAGLLTAALSAWLLSWPVLGVAAVLVASQAALSTVNWVASLLRRPRALPRMDFERGIPDDCRTLVVVPTLLTDLRRVDALLEGLELRYLANRDPNLWFGLLTDFGDADRETAEGDDLLLARAVAGIDALNAAYGARGRFLLLHRPRLFNARERCWMGRERKRGKLEDLNALLRGDAGERFSRIVGDAASLRSVRYVITLDTDTDLPWGAGWRLTGAAAHPLNRPRLEAGRLARGYVILQPRVSISLRSAQRSRYARLLAGDVGFDPYTRLISDLYQDLFAESSFIGKGIYDVDAFRALLHGRFPDNQVLSHDLLESCYARSGQLSDVELIEDAPARYLDDVGRRHRWMRGDWQIAPWLGPRVRDGEGRRVPSRVGALGRWKILDNLRRAFVAPAFAALLIVGWFVLPSPLTWTLALLSLLFVPELLPGLVELARRPPRLPLGLHAASVARSTARRLAKIVLWLTFLPFEAAVALDAAARSFWRMLLSRRRLLEWQTAASAESAGATGVGRMWPVPVLALVLAAAPGASAFAPLLLLWLLSPLVARWISRPPRSRAARLDGGDIAFLRRVARLTWRYFEAFVGPDDHWLPPDNVQEASTLRVARRTSPTNMGLSLLSTLTAHDLGYLSGGRLIDRSARSLEAMEALERHRGHFYNWYDTKTRRPLAPLYVSSVDSGNLVAHVRVLRAGLLELAAGPVLPAGAREGLRDTLRLLGEHDPSALEPLEALLDAPADGLAAAAAWLRALGAERPTPPTAEAAWWSAAFLSQAREFLRDLHELAPWLETGEPAPPGLDAASSLAELGRLARLQPGEPFQRGADRVAARLRQVDALAERCAGLAEAEFSFLYDPRRKLLSIGYWVAERRLDASFYDLLASEARLASFAAIASGQIPFEHWFALGRRLSASGGPPVLLSWSGSMFEYLMPLLVMPGFDGTLLDQTCRAAVERQRDYGRRRGLPWGISESCYGVTDGQGTYQYRAFGVPGLGLQRGLADDLVVAPYASALALLVDPTSACANLRRLETEGGLGDYGFYEAIDYTPARLRSGEPSSLIRTFMVHHHGMSLLALGQAVLGPGMSRRFLSHPDYRAASLLLQERVPKVSALIHTPAREVQAPGRVSGPAAERFLRVFSTPKTAAPEVHLLSNGRYHVMVSASGGGYSRWNGLALTRWREDPAADAYGLFCYVAEPSTGRLWSGAYQPTLQDAVSYEAVFTPGRAEFRRQDAQIETHTEIAVSTEDDLEIRRLRLSNRSGTARALEVTAYAEIVLAPGPADELHPAFSNLFVRTELLPELGAVLATRRPRSGDERPPWMFCLSRAGAGQVGPCRYETDRARFIGRGRSVRRPAALDAGATLAGTEGHVLDPCAALRRAVELPVDGSARIDVILGAAPTREAALALILKYQDHRMADRVFELAAAHSRAVLGHIGAGDAEARHYEELASAVIYPRAACRAPAGVLRRNRKGQSGLWGYAISGDLPIVLLRVSDADHLDLVGELMRSHAYWRMRGLLTDLVIWNEDVSGYRRELNDRILGLIAAGTESHLLDKPGGIFVRHVDAFPEEDRVLLQAVARVVIRDVDGPLEQQLERWRRASRPSRAARLSPSPLAPPPEPSVPPAPRGELLFPNGTGGFTRDGREYIIDLPPGRRTPAPWVNVIANERLGTVISESGSAYTWYGNAQLGRLTPWSNDPVGDPSGEVFHVRDEESGRAFSPTPWPRESGSAYACRHGFGYSVFEHREDGLETELKIYAALEAPVKFMSLKIRNRGGRPRRLAVLGCADLVLGDLRPRQAMHVVTELEPLTGAILARNSFNGEFGDAVAFFDCSEAVRTASGDRLEILGVAGDPADPAALRLKALSGRLGPGLDPCAALLVPVDLAEGAEREIVFVLGAGRDAGEAVALLQSHRGVGPARVALEEVWQYWNATLGVIYAETPDAALNVLANGWLPYQALSCRLRARSGFYQSGGAYGFRDQLQDCLALLHEEPGLARRHLLLCAERQFTEGDVQHWWHPPGGRGVRTRCSDDFLWLPYAAGRYVAFTGDTGVLDQPVPYLTGRALGDGEESYYDLPGRSERTGTLYEHCVRAIVHGLKLGPRGLPLMGSGDWNDGMNRVGIHGKGESVWLGFFLHDVLSRFAPLADLRGDAKFAQRCRAEAVGLAAALDAHAWDGAWYRRATFDDGTPLGSSLNEECRIDSLPQSWATIAGVGDEGRRRQALDAVWERLVDPSLKIIRLFSPPFDVSSRDPGYIKGYPPGVRENGGQYTHAAVWAAMAFAMAGRSAPAEALIRMLNPINQASDAEGVERYKVEPYVIAADIYGEAPHAGRGGWTWYTGSAGWYYRLLHEVVFGIERRVDTLRFRPRVPASWAGFKLHYRYYQTFYHLIFTRAPEHRGPIRLTLDGRPLDTDVLTLLNDQRDHTVELVFGPDAAETASAL